jgi:hypothetical protein
MRLKKKRTKCVLISIRHFYLSQCSQGEDQEESSHAPLADLTRLLAPVLAQLLELGQQLLVLALQELDAVDVLGEAVVQLAEHLLLLVALLADGHHRHGLHWRQLVVVAVGQADAALNCGALYFRFCHCVCVLVFGGRARKWSCCLSGAGLADSIVITKF